MPKGKWKPLPPAPRLKSARISLDTVEHRRKVLEHAFPTDVIEYYPRLVDRVVSPRYFADPITRLHEELNYEKPYPPIEEARAVFEEQAFKFYVRTPDLEYLKNIHEGEPEILFAGRTGAGKTRLINALQGLGRSDPLLNWQGAIINHDADITLHSDPINRNRREPHHPRFFTLYHVPGGRFTIIDTPGYNPAWNKGWGPVFRDIVENRPSIVRIYYIHQIHLHPTQFDVKMLKQLNSMISSNTRNLQVQPVFTHIDEVGPSRNVSFLQRATAFVYDAAPHLARPWLMTSMKPRFGHRDPNVQQSWKQDDDAYAYRNSEAKKLPVRVGLGIPELRTSIWSAVGLDGENKVPGPSPLHLRVPLRMGTDG